MAQENENLQFLNGKRPNFFLKIVKGAGLLLNRLIFKSLITKTGLVPMFSKLSKNYWLSSFVEISKLAAQKTKFRDFAQILKMNFLSHQRWDFNFENAYGSRKEAWRKLKPPTIVNGHFSYKLAQLFLMRYWRWVKFFILSIRLDLFDGLLFPPIVGGQAAGLSGA